MQLVYFFKNLTSNSTSIVPQNNSTAGTVASFQVPYTSDDSLTNQTFNFGLIVSGDVKSASVNLEISPDAGNTWTIIQSYTKGDLTYSDNSTPITQILTGGIFYNTLHRIKIVNPAAENLQNITAYFVVNDNTPIYSSNYIINMAFSNVPYSISNSNKDQNGNPNYISINSNSRIDFNTSNPSTPVTCCYPDGSAEVNTSLTSIQNISTNGYFYIIKEKGSNPYATTLQPIESLAMPQSPSVNQLWLDISLKPYQPKKWNGSSWNVVQFVKLGEFSRANGVISGLIQYSLNGKYTSQQTAITYGSVITVPHNLGIQPYLISEKIKVVNSTPELGYSAGDILAGAIIFNSSTFPTYVYAASLQSALSYNSGIFSTSVQASGRAGIMGYTKNGVTPPTFITPSNWKLVFSYERSF